MSHGGPIEINVDELFGKYSAEERKLYQELADAKAQGDSQKEAGAKQRIQQANIPDFIARYSQFIKDLEQYWAWKEAQQQKIAYHDAQIAAEKLQIASLEQQASQKMAAYAPGYIAQVDASMQKGGAATNGNGARHAAQPEKTKKKSSCTIL